MALRLKLKPKKLDPEIEALVRARPPGIRLKIYFAKQRRLEALQRYARKQERRTAAQKQQDFQHIDEFQEQWVQTKMKIRGSAKSWQRWWWDDNRPESHIIEEWEPWDRYGNPVNIWRYRRV